MERFQPEIMRSIMRAHGFEQADHWLFERFISIGYYALINYEEVNPQPDNLSDSIGWYELDQLPDLILDHGFIVQKALTHLRTHLDQKLLSINLLPVLFTMKDLQLVYEAILGEELNRANFQRKILSLDILDRHEKLFLGGSHKAPYLYSFKKKSSDSFWEIESEDDDFQLIIYLSGCVSTLMMVKIPSL